ncbi:MAG TPA: sugar phosphate isomerase/epimerase [Cyclobacteriaceae bacterium]
MDRRDFIKTSALLAMTVPGFAASVSKYRMGLQLFTIRGPMAKDPKATLKQVSALGFQDTETYGFDPEKTGYYGFSAADFKKVLEDNGLTTTSGHYDFAKYFNGSDDDLKRYVDQCIKGAHAVGQPYITWPWLDENSRSLDSFKLLAKKLNMMGEQIRKAGLTLAYHNHNFEFIDHNGHNGYEIVMNETDADLVKLQIDLYWAMHSSKLTPHELFLKQPGRFVMWHVKDMDKNTRDYTELGNGSIDYTKILPDAKLAGMQYYYLEQGGNFAKDPMTSITDSATFWKQNLEKYLG